MKVVESPCAELILSSDNKQGAYSSFYVLATNLLYLVGIDYSTKLHS